MAHLRKLRPERGETVRADVTAPLRTMTFPVLELILITGLSWMLIGWMDQPERVIDLQLRNGVVLLWAGLSLWRFAVPLVKLRRRRFIVTDQRILVRAAGWRSGMETIALSDITAVRRRRGGIALNVYGYPQTLYFPDVPKAKKITSMIQSSIPQSPGYS